MGRLADIKRLNDDVLKTLREEEISTVLAFAEYDMNIQYTADGTFFHRNTIKYRLESVKEKTGLDPKKFSELLTLVLSLGKVPEEETK